MKPKEMNETATRSGGWHGMVALCLLIALETKFLVVGSASPRDRDWAVVSALLVENSPRNDTHIAVPIFTRRGLDVTLSVVVDAVACGSSFQEYDKERYYSRM